MKWLGSYLITTLLISLSQQFWRKHGKLGLQSSATGGGRKLKHELYFPWSKEFFLDERSVRLLPAIKQSIRPDKFDIMICFNVFAGRQPSQELTPTSRWSQGQCYDDCGGSSWAEYPLSWPRILPVEVRTVATPDLNNNAVITVLVSHNIDQNYS